MLTKLTLSVNSRTVAKAKKKGVSVSRLFEEQILALTKEQSEKNDDPLSSLRRLKGVAKNVSFDGKYDDHDLIADIVTERHLK